MMSPAERRTLAAIRAELARLDRHDDESVAHDTWVRQRYVCGCYASYAPARAAAVRTAWHEAGHAVAALTLGATFTSASIHHGHRPGASSEGRVHGIICSGRDAFVIHAAGQAGERLMTWTLPQSDDDVTAFLRGWTADGGDARRFRRSVRAGYDGDEVGAWRYLEKKLVPRRQQIRLLARALLVHPRYLTCEVAAALVVG